MSAMHTGLDTVILRGGPAFAFWLFVAWNAVLLWLLVRDAEAQMAAGGSA